MKQKFLSFFAVITFLGIQVYGQAAKNNFNIEITVSDEQSGTLLMKNLTRLIPDTIRIVNGVAKYAGNAIEPTPFIVADEANKYQLFFVAPGDKVKITLRKKDMVVTFLEGSAAHEIFRGLIAVQEPLQQIGGSLQQAYSNPLANTDSLNRVMDKVNQKLKDNFYAFLEKNKNSEVTAFVVYSAINNDRNIRTGIADSMYRILTGPAKTGFYGTELNKMLTKLRAVEVGYMAPDFTLSDSSGKKKHTLSGYRGKYVLIDFWASWCGPCKQEIPYLKTAYSRFHNKGFEILSVSLDDNKDKWTAALRQFQMPWIHISDVKGFNSVVNELYHVPSIPKTLLLDKTGKIIATDLRGEALDRKLEEILGK
jgi:thiol-disulfide isomerase/thioredoxin